MDNNYKELLDGLSNKPRAIDSSIMMIDGLNTFLRSFTAINHVNIDGVHIGGLIGTLKSIAYGIRMCNPTYVIVIFDGVESASSRRYLYPPYKTNRHKNRATNYDIFSSKEEEDASIRDQISRLMQYLKYLPIALISVDSTEADDIIGYLSQKFEKTKDTEQVTIMSADKDFLQLISSKVRVWSPVKKKMYAQKEVLEEFQIPSHNFIMQKVLLGDVSDNIPGVSGLGPKKLVKLFPEIMDDKICNLKAILNKALDHIDEHKLYETVCGFSYQLIINEQLMNLKNIFLSEENIAIVKEMLSNRGTLDSHSFLRMYIQDNLGDSITNVPSWLNDNFNHLSSL